MQRAVSVLTMPIIVFFLLPLTGCPGSKAEKCSWGSICPPGQTCHDPTEQCVLPAQIAACSDKEDYDRCQYAGSNPDARCRDGICIVPFCGDGVEDPGEECDDGDDNSDTEKDGCRTDCRLAYCGDGIIDTGEECEEEDLDGFDCTAFGYANPGGLSCSDECTFDLSGCSAVCGNGILEPGEECDDGNTSVGDGCSPECEIEQGWECEGEPSVCVTGCGDGIASGDEECDGDDLRGLDCTDFDYANPGGLSCTAECKFDLSGCSAVCGNGVMEPGEECDDGDLDDGDGCSSTCEIEPGWYCEGEPSECLPDCGDGIAAGGEECDGDDLAGSDCTDYGYASPGGLSCSAGCTFDASGCTATCGNGSVEPGEECDDGTANSDTQPDACRTNCVHAFCGDGVKDTAEACDGTDLGGLDCTHFGYVNPNGLSCSGSCELDTSGCIAECGNGMVEPGEECDDGNPEDGDGCSQTCEVEYGWYCEGETSVCDTICGDGIAAGDEVCDVGDMAGELCLTQGFDGGTLGCEEDCLGFDTSECWTCGDGICDTQAGENIMDCPEDCGFAVVSAGFDHSCAIRNDGTAWCWGRNNYGQLGDGTSGQSNTPVQVEGLVDVTWISAGFRHTCAVEGDSTAWCWGGNIQGQLGDGTTLSKSTPVQVDGLANVTWISAGEYHTCASTEAGVSWCWGRNEKGQLGDGTNTDSHTPVQVEGLVDVTWISSGFQHACAVKGDGTAWCWGSNYRGQLGDGVYTDKNSPVQVVDLEDVTWVLGGEVHSCAVTNYGTAWCWGDNWRGQLGDGTTERSYTPVQVYGIENAAFISAGWEFSCALMNDHTVWCWGANFDGQLGDGNGGWDVISELPVQVENLEDATGVSTGQRHACAVRDDGTAVCWGRNQYGQLGDGTTADRTVPVGVAADWNYWNSCLNPFTVSEGWNAFTGVFDDNPEGLVTCASLAANAVWFEFTAPDDDLYVISAKNNTSTSAYSRLVILDGNVCMPYGDELHCSTANSKTIGAEIALSAGQTILIAFLTDGLIYTMVDPEIRITRACNQDLEFTCGDGTCIPLEQLCDGIEDCPDGSDEVLCGPGERCRNPFEVDIGWNGLTGDFEDNPEGLVTCASLAANAVWFEFIAPDDGIYGIQATNNTSTFAYSRLVILDGSACNPYGDELHCSTANSKTIGAEIALSAGQTVLIAFLTDGVQYTMVDPEVFIYEKCDPDTEFDCGQDTCIPLEQLCDGTEDCPDGSDEVLCGPGERCRNPFEVDIGWNGLTGDFEDNPEGLVTCASLAANAVWFEFTAPDDGNYSFYAENNSTTDAWSRLVILDGSACNPYGDELHCSTANSKTIGAEIALSAGQTILIAFLTDGLSYTMVDPELTIEFLGAD